jgi:hypothetical protein
MMKLMNTSPAPRTLTRRAMMLSTAAAVTSLTAFGKFGKIDLGVCGKPADFAKTAEYGYDYFEPSAAALAAMTDTAFSAFKDQVQASKTKCDSVNILFSGQNHLHLPRFHLRPL